MINTLSYIILGFKLFYGTSIGKEAVIVKKQCFYF